MPLVTRALLKDAAVVALAGVGLALIANAVSPRGLSLTRDYFAVTPAPTASRSTASAPLTPPTTVKIEAPVTEPSVSKRGLPLVTHAEAVALFKDPRRAEQRILFIDARDAAHYAEGHVPGAYPFDHYHPERDMADVLAIAPLAERIVVYCTGGDCEDSELATLDLVALGIPRSKLVIYGGGITAWRQHDLPIETGARGGRATRSRPTP